jgi:hypothetical protein
MMTNTNTDDGLVVSCAHALGASSWCWLVVGVQSSSMVLYCSCCRLRHLPSPSTSCTAQAFATWNHACIHVVCMYCISPSMEYVRTPTAAGGTEVLLFALDAIWYIIIHPQ